MDKNFTPVIEMNQAVNQTRVSAPEPSRIMLSRIRQFARVYNAIHCQSGFTSGIILN